MAFWVYVVLKFVNYKYCKEKLGWKELGTVTKTNTAANLNRLVEAVHSELSVGSLVQYSILPLAYIILSLLVSIGYLIVFQLWDEDVVIQITAKKMYLILQCYCNKYAVNTTCNHILLECIPVYFPYLLHM